MGRKHWSIASLTAVFGILGLVLLIHAQLQHSGKRALLFVPTPGQGVGFTQHGHAIIGEATAQQLESMAGTFRQLDNSVRASFDEEREGKDGGVANAEIERKWPNAFDEFVVRASPPEQPAAAPGAGQTMLSGACLPGSNTAYSYQDWKTHGCCGTVEHDDNGDVFCTGSAPAAAPTTGAAQYVLILYDAYTRRRRRYKFMDTIHKQDAGAVRKPHSDDAGGALVRRRVRSLRCVLSMDPSWCLMAAT